MLKQIWLASVAVVFTSVCAFGTTTTDTFWQIAGAGGSYTYAGASASDTALHGANIIVDSVQAANNSTPFGTLYGLLGASAGHASLNFTSGANSGGWTWTGGGTLNVVGCVEDPGNLGNCIFGETTSTVLVSDEFSSVAIADLGGGIGIAFGGLRGTLDSTVAALFGISSTFASPPSTMHDVLTGLPSTTGDSFTTVGQVHSTPSGGNLDLFVPVPESSNLYSTFGIFALGFGAFVVVSRFGLIRAL